MHCFQNEKKEKDTWQERCYHQDIHDAENIPRNIQDIVIDPSQGHCQERLIVGINNMFAVGIVHTRKMQARIVLNIISNRVVVLDPIPANSKKGSVGIDQDLAEGNPYYQKG